MTAPPTPAPAPEAAVPEGARQEGARPDGARAARHARVGPRAALIGAGLAVVGVLVGIGALLLATSGQDQGSPTVLAPPGAATGVTSTAPSSAPAATAAGVASAPPVSARPPLVLLPAATKPPAAHPAPRQAPVGAARLPVTVLNNSRFTGLAQRAAARYRAGGWSVPVTGNFTGRLRETTVYFAPGQQASAVRFASQFGVPRVLPRFAGLPGRGLTVVLTRDAA